MAVLLAVVAIVTGGTGAASADRRAPQAGEVAASRATPAVRHFENVRFQRCLDADTNTGGNGGKVQLWDCGPWNQQWWR
ncbi:RICIN domain-containing protein [Saccharothrix saharensis]|nr:ricin-type beta-trefoil lectin domain protein [Saccharothrix saharensis]